MRPVILFANVVAMVIAISAFADPSFAQWFDTKPAPAPLIGMIGLPVAGLVLAAVWLARSMGRD
jgi:hypothetical protein